MQALGIDIGGTKISYALINKNGEIKSEIKKISTPKTKDEIFKTLKDIISKYENEIEFCAIATAGAVNNANNKVLGSTANLANGYPEIDFSSLSNKKVFIENDANCAAWAEYKIGASKDYDNSVMLTLGTGVGGGIIINGQLLKGSKGTAGEMHFKMSRKKERQCTCGEFDCFEAYASGNGLRKTAIEITKNENITTYDVIEGVKNNDNKCVLALQTWQNDIKDGIIGLTNIFNPDCFILSGSMEKFVDTNWIENEVNKSSLVGSVRIFHAKAGNYSGMIGAVLLAFDKLY